MKVLQLLQTKQWQKSVWEDTLNTSSVFKALCVFMALSTLLSETEKEPINWSYWAYFMSAMKAG